MKQCGYTKWDAFFTFALGGYIDGGWVIPPFQSSLSSFDLTNLAIKNISPAA
jgi:hypothetical protein